MGLHHELSEHLALVRSQQVERTLDAPQVLCCYLCVTGRGLDGGMTEQALHGTNVFTQFEHMLGKTVAQRMRSDTLGEPRLRHGLTKSPANAIV